MIQLLKKAGERPHVRGTGQQARRLLRQSGGRGSARGVFEADAREQAAAREACDAGSRGANRAEPRSGWGGYLVAQKRLGMKSNHSSSSQ